MEIFSSFIEVPYIFHCLMVSCVLLGAILLFVFGFKSTEEPSFGKAKMDSKASVKKKKGKDKNPKGSSGSPKLLEFRMKTNINAKTKTSKADDRGRNSNALKDSKSVNIDAQSTITNAMSSSIERKKKGKENVIIRRDSADEEGGWERALSRKDRKSKRLHDASKKALKHDSNEWNAANTASSKKENRKHLENLKNKSTTKDRTTQDINIQEDFGSWQEAKSSKKRRKIQREA